MGWQPPHEALLREGGSVGAVVRQEVLQWFGLSFPPGMGWDGGSCLSTLCVVGNMSCEGWVLSPFTTVAFLVRLELQHFMCYHPSKENEFCKGSLSLASMEQYLCWLGVLSLDRVAVWKCRGSADFCIFVVFGIGSICFAGGVLQKGEVNESSCPLEGLPVNLLTNQSFASFLFGNKTSERQAKTVGEEGEDDWHQQGGMD